MTPTLQNTAGERQHSRLLGVCPSCGRAVAASVDALRYDGGFHHISCALQRREQAAAHQATARSGAR